MDFDSDDETNIIEEDFYAFLNIPRDASKEDINNAYRRLSRLYHPDKHLDEESKAKAELLFNKTKRAYEVLSDPHQRAIYDSLGVKGLDTEGWEVVQRTRTPAEIRAEYEQLAEERAERKKQQRTNPHGLVTININATDLFNPYVDELMDDDVESGGLPNIEVSGMTFNQSVEFPLTQKDTCTMSGSLHTQNGNGNGDVSFSWRHIYSHKSWIETEFAAGNGPVFSLKAFRTLSKRFFWNGGTMLQLAPQGFRGGLVSTIAMQIDKHSVGYLTYQGGLRNFVSSSIVRDTETGTGSLIMQLGLPHSFVSVSYARKMMNQELKLKVLIKLGTFGGLVEYGVERKVSKHSNLSAAVSVGVPSGIKLKIRLTRANQVYSFPIHLCEEVMPAPIFYATIVPLVVYVVVQKGFVEPFLKEQRARKVEKQRQDNRQKMAEKRKEAQAAVDLMQAAYERIMIDETSKNGLVVVRAIYGKICAEEGDVIQDLTEEAIDVTIPLQCLVKDSKLVLHDLSKSQLPGFFDPAVGEEKSLHIAYTYRNQQHEVLAHDTEPIRIPKLGKSARASLSSNQRR
ncbi:dnaJ homolog subfamily C member 11 [Atheta coriaria]|uniref:dnaJ homolog subfamily C member 11 n=1 Tax=Dalotia coriaria TaxID=877792 RepID=UPI0031F3B112